MSLLLLFLFVLFFVCLFPYKRGNTSIEKDETVGKPKALIKIWWEVAAGNYAYDETTKGILYLTMWEIRSMLTLDFLSSSLFSFSSLYTEKFNTLKAIHPRSIIFTSRILDECFWFGAYAVLTVTHWSEKKQSQVLLFIRVSFSSLYHICIYHAQLQRSQDSQLTWCSVALPYCQCSSVVQGTEIRRFQQLSEGFGI